MNQVVDAASSQVADGLVFASGATLVIGVVLILLNVVLFFKIWGMTNDSRKIKDILQEWIDLEHPLVDNDEDTNKPHN